MTTAPPVYGERYQLVRHIARGGMAQVYLARDLMLDRQVALKVLFPELSVDQAFVERFRREARSAANLAHPNVVSVYDWGQGDQTYFIVMEFVDGETLSARIRRGPIPSLEAARLASSVAAALAFAHEHNVIHRDVKPGNVLIDRSGQVKVADFGIARAVGVSEDLTQAGSVMGTATYFSPEQAQGQAVDARSDVYSLGVVLYEMVTGRPPFQADNPVGIAFKHVRDEPEPPTMLNRAVDPGLERIILSCMAKDPAQRYPDARSLRADLERYLAGTSPLGAGVAAGAAAATATTPPRGTVLTAPPPAPPPAAPPPADRRPGPPPPPDERTGRSGAWIALIVVLLVALAAVGYLVGRDLGLVGARSAMVPAVAGQPEASALSRLRAAGFGHVTVHRSVDATVASGDAVGTSPTAGQHLRTSATVVLTVSTGPQQVRIPDVAGQTQSAAVVLLEGSGFGTSVSQQPSTTVTSGHVVATRPAAGTMTPVGTRIEVVVSSGPPAVVIPSLVGESPAVAGAALENLGLVVAAESPQASAAVPAGEVSGTDPPANAQVATGTKVTVYVSDGPPKVTVPDLSEYTQGRAVSTLVALGLQATVVQVPTDRRYQQGRVQATDPVAGTQVDAGTTVTLSVGQYTPTTTSTTTTTTTTAPGGPPTPPAP